MNPWFITGFSNAEGCFTFSIIKDNKYNTGWRVKAIFSIGLHSKDKVLLENIQSYFNAGGLYPEGTDLIKYYVTSEKGLGLIMDHFNKYPLISKKLVDYLLFKQGFEIIKTKQHLTK